MKNFVKHTLAIAICAVALLSSCIKEESYVTQDVILDVQLTRAGTDSEQQGDQIEDIMLWAFELNGDGEVINNNPVGWLLVGKAATAFLVNKLHAAQVVVCARKGHADHRGHVGTFAKVLNRGFLDVGKSSGI